MKELPIEYIKKTFSYSPKTGLLRWKKRTDTIFANACIGKIAGSHDKDGYIRVEIGKSSYYPAHRIIHAIVTGKWPIADIDHINGVRDDNRWVNLRLATRQQNLRNMKLRSSNKSGFKWVSWSKPAKKWIAQIRDSTTNRYIGVFNTPEEAFKAAQTVALELHGSFVRSK